MDIIAVRIRIRKEKRNQHQYINQLEDWQGIFILLITNMQITTYYLLP